MSDKENMNNPSWRKKKNVRHKEGFVYPPVWVKQIKKVDKSVRQKFCVQASSAVLYLICFQLSASPNETGALALEAVKAAEREE